MKIKDYISREVIVRAGIFLVLMAAAIFYDFNSGSDEKLSIPVENSRHDSAEQAMFCISFPNAAFSLKTPVQKAQPGSITREDADQSLRIHHTALAFHILKAEIPDLPAEFLLRHFTAFRHYHFTTSEDHPPLA